MLLREGEKKKDAVLCSQTHTHRRKEAKKRKKKTIPTWLMKNKGESRMEEEIKGLFL